MTRCLLSLSRAGANNQDARSPDAKFDTAQVEGARRFGFCTANGQIICRSALYPTNGVSVLRGRRADRADHNAPSGRVRLSPVALHLRKTARPRGLRSSSPMDQPSLVRNASRQRQEPARGRADRSGCFTLRQPQLAKVGSPYLQA